MHDDKRPFKDYSARHFRWQCSDDGRVATITLNRPEKKNPLTFDSYAELRDCSATWPTPAMCAPW